MLPEMAVTGEISGDIVAHSVPLEGSLRNTLRARRGHNCYIVVRRFLLEDRQKKVCSNAAILIGRKGEVVGIYRKLHLAVHTASDSIRRRHDSR